jgi:hypothetical protein
VNDSTAPVKAVVFGTAVAFATEVDQLAAFTSEGA